MSPAFLSGEARPGVVVVVCWHGEVGAGGGAGGGVVATLHHTTILT